MINLLDAIDLWAKEQIRLMGYEPIEKDPLIQLFTLRIRNLEPIPRRICVSSELIQILPSLPTEIQNSYAVLKNAVEKGSALRPYMSKSIDDVTFFDGFLFDWGFYHFHLATAPVINALGFIARSDFLLVARVEDDIMYFVQILPHKDYMLWYHEDLIRIFANNWPDVAEQNRIKFADSLTEMINEEQRKAYRDVIHANVPVDLGDGRVYWGANLGISGAGIPVIATLRANEIKRNAFAMQMVINEKWEAIVDVIKKKTDEVPEFQLVRIGPFDYTFQAVNIVLRLIWQENNITIAVGDDERQIEEYLQMDASERTI